MARKRKPAKKRDPNEITAVGKPDEGKAEAIARTALRPTVQAAIVLKEYGKTYGDLDLTGLMEALTAQTDAVADGDLGRAEAMLTAQAHVLNGIFSNLARRAINAEYMDNLDRYLKLALRAQSQSRATWETLATIKNPPIVGYVRQANIAHGHQQVNNAPSIVGEAPRTQVNVDPQNKLLEAQDGERLDTRAKGTPGQADPALATLGELDRTEDAGG